MRNIKPHAPKAWAVGEQHLKNLLGYMDTGELGDGTNVFEHQTPKVETFTTALNGPTARVFFVFDEYGDLEDAFMWCYHGGDEALIPIPQLDQKDLLLALRRDAKTLEAHGG